MKFFCSAILIVLSISTSLSQSEGEFSHLSFDSINDTIQKYSYTDVDRTITAANAYILKSQRENDLINEWVGLNAIAVSYYHNRMFKESSEQSEKNMHFAQKHNLREQEMESLAYLSDLQLVVSDVSTQLEYYEDLLQLAETYKSNFYKQIAYNKIASVLDVSGDTRKAINIRKKSLDFFENKTADSTFTQKSINSKIAMISFYLSNSYLELEKVDSAKLYVDKIKQFSEKDLDTCYMAFSYAAEAEIAYTEKRFKEAKKLYHKYFDVCPTEYDLIKINYAYLIGKIELAEGNYRLASEILQKGLDDYNVTSVEEGFMKDYYEKLAEAYKQTGNFERASFYFEKYLTSKEKQTELKDSAKKSLLENEREAFRNEVNSLITEKENKQSYLNYLMLSASLVILILLFVLLRFYKNKKANEFKFEQLLAKIEAAKQSDEIIDTKDEDLEEKNSNDVPEDIKQHILDGLKKLEKQEYFLKQECSSYNVAKKIGTNTSYLSKVINSHYGKNFNTYINDLRINYAILRLKNDVIFRSYSIQSIAEEVGYKSADSFTKYFKKDTGLNPSFYIKEIKNIA